MVHNSSPISSGWQVRWLAARRHWYSVNWRRMHFVDCMFVIFVFVWLSLWRYSEGPKLHFRDTCVFYWLHLVAITLHVLQGQPWFRPKGGGRTAHVYFRTQLTLENYTQLSTESKAVIKRGFALVGTIPYFESFFHSIFQFWPLVPSFEIIMNGVGDFVQRGLKLNKLAPRNAFNALESSSNSQPNLETQFTQPNKVELSRFQSRNPDKSQIWTIIWIYAEVKPELEREQLGYNVIWAVISRLKHVQIAVDSRKTIQQ